MDAPAVYKAFISYCHADMALARRLHAWLETYEIPAGLDRPTDAFRPIFRDEDELAAGGLDARLKAALAQSQRLIVIASPSAAQSRWVEQEVRHFLTLHPREGVFAIVAAGVPNSADASIECLPPSLRASAHDNAASAELFAPMIAASGEESAFLRLAAGLLDVSYGALFDRHAEREAARARRRSRSLARAYAAAANLASAAGDHERSLKYAAAYLIDTGDTQWAHAPELQRSMRDDALATCLRTTSGGGGSIGAACLSGDALLAAVYYEMAAVLAVLDIENARTIFTARTGAVAALAFTRDGETLVSRLVSGKLVSFDLPTGRLVGRSPTNWIDGRLLPGARGEIILSSLGRTAILDARTLRPRLQIHHAESATAVAYSPRHQLLACALRGRGVEVWPIERGDARLLVAPEFADLVEPGMAAAGIEVGRPSQLKCSIDDGDWRSITRLVFAADDSLLVAISSGGALDAWCLARGTAIRARPNDNDGSVGCIGVLACDTLCLAFESGRIEAWEVRPSALRPDAEVAVPERGFEPLARVSSWLAEPATAIGISQDGSLVALGGRRGPLTIREARSGIETCRLVGHGGNVMVSGFIAPDRLASVSSDGDARVWPTWSGRRIARFGLSRGPGNRRDRLRAAAFSPTASAVAACSMDGRVVVWDLATLKPQAQVRQSAGTVALRFAPDGSRLALCDMEGRVTVRDGESLKLVEEITLFKGTASDCQWSDDGRQLLAVDIHGNIRLWSLAAGLVVVEAHILRMSSADTLAMGAIFVTYDSAIGRFLVASEQGQPLSVSADGCEPSGEHAAARRAMIAADRGLVRLEEKRDMSWLAAHPLATVGSGSLPVELVLRLGAEREIILARGEPRVVNAAISADARIVAACGRDHLARVWSAETGALLAQLPIEAAGLDGFELSGDGRLLAVGDNGWFDLYDLGDLLLSMDGQLALLHGALGRGVGPLRASERRDLLLAEIANDGTAAGDVRAALASVVPAPVSLSGFSPHLRRVETLLPSFGGDVAQT
jgi:WD40 repeat protein